MISLIILSVVLSVGVAFAASDDADLTANNVIDEIAVDEGASPADVLEVTDEVDADDVVEAESSENDDVASDNPTLAQESNVVTKDTFFNYFDGSGTLLSNVTSDELIFEGDFSGISVGYMTINKPIKFTGNNAVFDGVSFVIDSNDVTVDGFTITQSDVYLFYIGGKENVTLSNNFINYATLEGFDGYAIYADFVSKLNIINNTIDFTGNTDGTTVNNVIYVTGDVNDEISSDTILVKGNTFDIKIPSVAVGYDPDTWESKVMSEGIVFYYCDDVEFIDNRLDIRYNTFSGSYDTIYGVSFRGDASSFGAIASSGIVVSNNTINAEGHNYMYAIYLSCDDFKVSNNTINVSSDEYYANGINIDGPASSGEVSNNKINVTAPSAVYGIYSYQFYGAVEDISYINNTIVADSYAACAMELVECNPYVHGNTIVANGNYTYGMVVSIRDNGAIVLNNISSLGSNVGSDPISDSLLPLNSMGISVKGEAVIEANTISSSNTGVNIVKQSKITLYNNIIDVVALGNVASYAICSNNASNIEITKNTIKYVGNTDGTFVNNAILITGDEKFEHIASDITVNDNIFEITIPSVAVGYDPVTWESKVFSEGIVFYYCKNVEFANNNVTLDYNNAYGDYDTIYVVSVRGNPYNFDADGPIECTNVSIINNVITANGYGYIYGIFAAANDLNVSKNDLTITADDYYANGIDIEGPSNGVVSDNNVIVGAPGTVYGIYSSFYNGAIENMIYNNNTVVVNAYAACGMELLEINPVVSNNDITAVGNYTYGIVASILDNATIVGNTINCVGSNVGKNDTGDSLLPFNSMGVSVKGNVKINKNDISSSNIGVNIVKQSKVTLDDNTIDVVAEGNIASYAIYSINSNDIEITNNYIKYVGNTDGTFVNNAVLITGDEKYEHIASRITVSDNTFDIYIPSVPVYYDPDTWESKVLSEGIVFYYCELVEFAGNDVTLVYNNASGSYDTIYVVSVKGNPYNFDAEDPIACSNVIIRDNNITADGHGYIYGIYVSADELDVSYNKLIISADDYYANAIDVEGPSNGNVHHNNITVSSPGTSYGIYSSTYNGAVQDMGYFNNNVLVDAYAACGMELLEKNPLVLNNSITATGNYTYGIVASITTAGDIIGNNIVCSGSEVGTTDTGDSLLPLTSIGISVKSEAQVENNTVESTNIGIKAYKADLYAINNIIKTAGDYAIVLERSNATVIDNYLTGKKGVGDNSITGDKVIEVSGNTPSLKVLLFGVDLTKVYGDGQFFTVILVDENQDPIANKTITISIGDVNMTNVTDEKGVARFDVDLAGGNYTVISSYAGDDVYGPKSTENIIVVNPKATEIISSNTVSVYVAVIKKGLTYKVTLKDDEGNVLANKKVTIKFDGKTYSGKTNANGLINFKLTATKTGNKKLTINFAGDENYTAATKTVTIKVNKEAAKLNAKNKVYKKAKKSKKAKKAKKAKKFRKYSVTLKDSNGKAIKKVKLTLKIKNKTFKAKTNAKGKATFKISKKVLKKGKKVTAKVTFAGNDFYNKVTKSVKLKVKK